MDLDKLNLVTVAPYKYYSLRKWSNVTQNIIMLLNYYINPKHILYYIIKRKLISILLIKPQHPSNEKRPNSSFNKLACTVFIIGPMIGTYLPN